MRHKPSSLSAKAFVNFSGMCCTITIPGASAGSGANISRSASVPPVEAPIASTLYHVRQGIAQTVHHGFVELRLFPR